MANKTCTKCKQTKALTDFYKAHYTWPGDGYDYYCKYCRKGTHLRGIENNKKQCSISLCEMPHYAKTYCRKHYSRLVTRGTVKRKNETVDSYKEYKYKKSSTSYDKNKLLMHTYKITLEEFNERTQDGCELCGQKSLRSYQVDHDHSCCSGRKSCGKCTRGIVCNKCNAAIDKMEKGVMREDYPNYWLIKQYLEIYG